MKILVYGAGVVGSFFAAQLQNNGHEISVLARGRRVSDITEHGIVLEDALKGGQTITRVNVVEKLSPEDVYDMVLVCVRKNHIKDVLAVLSENQNTPNVVFMVNNASGPDGYATALGAERVLLSFSCTAGVREGKVVRCLIPKNPSIPLGELTGWKTPRIKEIVEAFNQAHIKVSLFRDMDAWLKYHVAVVSPIGNATILTGGNYQLAQNETMIRLMVRAVREGFGVLKELGYPVTPRKFIALKRIPEWILVILMRRAMNTKSAEIAVSGHALNAVDEMKYLSCEFQTLIEKAGLHTPAINELHAAVMSKYL